MSYEEPYQNYPSSTWEGDPRAPWNEDYYAEEPEPENAPLSTVEKLAVAQAFYNAVGKMVNTKDPSNLRGEANAFYEGEYGRTGAKSFDVKLLGSKVGTYSITVSKPKKSEKRVELEVVDEDELFNWADENGFVSWTVDIDAVNENFRDYGEVPPGCKAVEVVTPAEDGGRITRTTLKVDAESVIDALGPRLEGVSTMLLEGAE